MQRRRPIAAQRHPAAAACRCRRRLPPLLPAAFHPHSAAQDQGNAAFKAGNFEEAAEHFSAAIELDSSNHVLYSNRSAAYASLKRYDAALKDARKTVDLKPDWARVGAAAVCSAWATGRMRDECWLPSGRQAPALLLQAAHLQAAYPSAEAQCVVCSECPTTGLVPLCTTQGYSRLGAAYHGLRQWDDAVQAYNKGEQLMVELLLAWGHCGHKCAPCDLQAITSSRFWGLLHS